VAPERGARHQQAANAKDGDGEEVHDQDGGARIQAGEQRHGAGGVPATQAQVVEARLPHLLVRLATLVAEDLQWTAHVTANGNHFCFLLEYFSWAEYTC
jgi:hypothetical protein